MSSPAIQETAEISAVNLIPMPHGGSLLPGGQPGNAGGTGRPSSKFRETCQNVTIEALPEIAAIAKGTLQRGDQVPSFSDSNTAWNNLAKMGFGEAKVTVPEEVVEAVARMLSNPVHEVKVDKIPGMLHELFDLLRS